jgi:hypothetical protein
MKRIQFMKFIRGLGVIAFDNLNQEGMLVQ